MERPLLSIVITVLNADNTLEACLTSIQRQTFNDFELIIVDGGSSDDSLGIISQFNVPNLKLEVAPGISLYAGLNLGISLSVGEWIYFLGADDELYEQNTLEQVAAAIARRAANTQVMVGSVEFKTRKTLHNPKLGNLRLMHYQVHHQGMFYYRALFKHTQFDETMRIAADYKFNLKLVQGHVVHEDMAIVVCRFGEEGISSRLRKVGLLEMQYAHKQVFKGIEQIWITGLFWLRSTVGEQLRALGLYRTLSTIKKIVG